MRRIDGIHNFVRSPVVRKHTRRFSLIAMVLALVLGLVSTSSFPTTTNGETGAASGNRVWSSGAELNSLTADMEISGTSGTTSVSSTTKRSGTYAFRTNPTSGTSSNYKTWASSAQNAPFWFREYLFITTAPSSGNVGIMEIGNGATNLVGIRLTSTRTLQLFNETGTPAQIGSDSSALSTSTWYRIELYIDSTTSTAAAVTLRLDGASTASTGSTSLGAGTGLTRMTWGSMITSATTDLFFDDIAINNSNSRSDNWPGEGKIVFLRPNAAGDNTGFTIEGSSCASNYLCANEVTPDDVTTREFSSALNVTDDYNITDTATAGINPSDLIKLVAVGDRYARCTSNGSTFNNFFVGHANAAVSCPATLGSGNDGHKMRLKASSGGTVTLGTEILDNHASTYVTNDYTTTTKLYTLTSYAQPGTSTPWTAAALDSSQIGIIDSTHLAGTKLTNIWLLVEYAAQTGGRVYSSGFELNSTTANMEWTTITGSPAIVSSPIRSGTYAMQTAASGAGSYMAYTFAGANSATTDDYYFRSYLRVTTLPNAEWDILELKNSSSTKEAWIRMTATGTLKLFSTSGGSAQIGSASSALSTGTWYRLEIRFKLGAAGAGIVDAQIDGSSFASSTTLTPTTGITQYAIGDNLGLGIGSAGQMVYDDVAINLAGNATTQNSWPGAGSIVDLLPNAAGDNAGWTKNGAGCTGGANYTCVDEVTPDDGTTYVSATTANTIDDYNIADPTFSSSSTINVVSAGVRFSAAAATQEDFRVRLKDSSGGVPIESNNLSPATTTWVTNQTASPYNYSLNAYTRPEQNSSWTTTDITNAQIGVRDINAGTGTAQVSDVWLLVDYTAPTFSLSGTIYQTDQTTVLNCSSGGARTVKVVVAGGAGYTSTCTLSAGTYSITNITMNAGDALTIYLSGATEKAATFDVSTGANMTGVDLYQNRAATRCDNTCSLTNTNIDSWDKSNDGDIHAGVTTSNLTVDNDWKLLIVNNTYAPGGTVTMSTGGANTYSGDVEIKSGATFNIAANALSISGNYTNSGTFTSTTNTTTFSATASGKTLSGTMTSSSSFYNVTFNGASGGWTLGAAMATGNNFDITNGTFDTSNASNYALTVTGNLTGNAGTWSFLMRGSTITVSGNWDTSAAASLTAGTSTVVMNGSGSKTIKTVGSGSGNIFYNLQGGAAGGKTTQLLSGIAVNNVFTLGAGTVDLNANALYFYCNGASNPNPLSLNASGTFGVGSGPYTGDIIFSSALGACNMNLPAFNYQAGIGNQMGSGKITFQGTTTLAGKLAMGCCTPTSAITSAETDLNNQNVTVAAVGWGNGAPVLDGGSGTLTITSKVYGDNWDNCAPGGGGCSAGPGVFNKATSTVVFTETTADSGGVFYSNGASFYNVSFSSSDGTGSWTPTDTTTVTNDFTMTSGTLNGTNNFTINGNVASTGGTISLTGGTFEQRVAANKNFGATSGSTAWTFSSLTFSNSTGAAKTITTQTSGTGAITVSGVMIVGKAADTASTVLDAGNRSWTLSGTGGDPLQINNDGHTSSITGNASTFTYNGDWASGNTSIDPDTNGSYFNLTVSSATETYVLSGATVATGQVANLRGTLSTTGSNYALTAGTIGLGPFVNPTINLNGSAVSLTASSGTLITLSVGATLSTGTSTVTVNAGGSATLVSTSNPTFYNLTINSSGNVITTGRAITVNNNLAINAGTLADGGNQITGNGTGTLTAASGTTMRLGLSGAVTLFPTSFTAGHITLNVASTVVYQSYVAQTVSSVPTYGNLQISGASGTPIKVLNGSTAVAGNLTIDGGTTLNTVSGSNFALAIAGSYTNNGTFMAQNGTVTFSSTVTGKTLTGTLNGSSAFYNLTFSGSGGDWTPGSAVLVSNNLTMTAGSLLGTQNVNVNGGNATGDGIINLTSGTFTINGTGNFGGNTGWTFYNLSIGGTGTSTISATGSGGITTTNNLSINGNGITANSTLNGGSKTWTFSGAIACPFFTCGNATAAGQTFTAQTSTVNYTGNYAGGDTGTANTTYYNLTLNNGSETYDLATSITINNNLTITAGTLDTTASNYNLTVGGNYANSGAFTARLGTVTFNGTSTQTLSGNMTSGTGSAFYNLTITNNSGANPSGNEVTGMTASVAFSNDATAITYTINAAHVRVQYNSGSMYTFANISWTGVTGAGNSIYFRNSATSASWLMNVSSLTQTVSYVNVSRSAANYGSTINATNGTNTDSTNNVNWSFFVPVNPASLAQYKSNGSTVLNVGDWTNETTVIFKASISDGDNPASIALCVEKKALGNAFVNTEDACGSNVAYSGTPVTGSVTISGLVDATEYHWQARVKDSGGAYSSWISFGGNAEAARDFGVDTTACSTNTVYDGTSVGSETVFNTGALDTLSANWNAFTCTVSGLNFYEYSIGTTVGGVDIKGWTNNSTTTSVTIGSLNLHTNQVYYFNVRATDNASNLSSVASSSGQTVLPTISFSLSSNSVTFSNLGINNNRSDTQTTTTTTSTNAYGGYVITQYAGGLLTSGGNTIPMFQGGTYASPAAWGTLPCTSGTNCGFGYTSSDTTIQGSNKFSSGTLYAPYSQTPAGDIVADHTAAVTGGTGAVVNESFTITHKVATSPIQAIGSYTATVYYIVTGTF